MSTAAKKPITIRLKEFLQNFHDTDQYASDRAFCFILGSGAAHTAGIPTGASLVNRWLVEMHDMDDASEKRILPPNAKIEDYADALMEGEKERLRSWSEMRFSHLNSYSFEDRAKFYGHIYHARFEGEPTLGQQFLRKLIHRRKPSIGYHLLARILNRTRHNVVITTNFDHLVEDSIALTENEAVQSFGHAELAAYLQSRPAHPVVAKIHGDILLETYNARDKIETLGAHWQKALKALFQTYTPIVVGYGGNDPGFMSFLLDEMKVWGGERRCYWCVRNPADYDRIPFGARLANVEAFRLIDCPGFTPLMLKLNEIFSFAPLHEELKKRSETVAAELREADIKARGDLAAIEQFALKSFTISAVKKQGKTTLETTAKYDWLGWRDALRASLDQDARKAVLAEAIKALPHNLSLPVRATAAALDVVENPTNTIALDAILGWLKNSESKFGAESEETLEILDALGVALYHMAAFDKAEPVLRRLVAARERVIGAEHPDTLTSRSNLATTLSGQGKHVEAEEEHRTVLQIRERVLGPQHPDTLTSHNNLAATLLAQGKNAEAEEEFRNTLGVLVRVLGPEHPNTLTSRNNLAVALHAQGKGEEAEAEVRADLGIRERVLGPDHPDVFGSCFSLAIFLDRQGKKTEALVFARRAWKGRLKILGEKHPETKEAKKLVELLEQSQ